MRNLFIIHTQYNLLLAVGLCMSDFEKDCNDLILFREFNIKNSQKRCIKKVFDRVKILEGNSFAKSFGTGKKLVKIRCDNRKIKEFIDFEYERIFIVDDMCIQEMYALKCVYRKNRGVRMSWLEDGTSAYFSSFDVSKGMGATPLRRLIRKIFFSIVFGMWKYYDLGSCIGTHKLLKQAYLVYPELARPELTDKELVGISDRAFILGVKALFDGDQYQFEENGVIIVVDKLDIYGDNLDKVNGLIAEEVGRAHDRCQKIYYKYHPRETEKLPAVEFETELDRNIAIEGYLANSNTKNLTVRGAQSTSLQTAKKMGYKVISLIQRVEPDNVVVIDFYKKINIECV